MKSFGFRCFWHNCAMSPPTASSILLKHCKWWIISSRISSMVTHSFNSIFSNLISKRMEIPRSVNNKLNIDVSFVFKISSWLNIELKKKKKKNWLKSAIGMGVFDVKECVNAKYIASFKGANHCSDKVNRVL